MECDPLRISGYIAGFREAVMMCSEVLKDVSGFDIDSDEIARKIIEQT